MSGSQSADDAVFDAVVRLVAAGEYRDELYGKPSHDLEGGGMFVASPDGEPRQRVYFRCSREYEAARSAGVIQLLPRLRPAAPEAVEEAEEEIGYPLTPLLRRLYLEVGNGGFGPGYGILGLKDGHSDDGGHTAIELYRERAPREGLLPVCYWGCGIYSLIDCRTGRMWASTRTPCRETRSTKRCTRRSSVSPPGSSAGCAANTTNPPWSRTSRQENGEE